MNLTIPEYPAPGDKWWSAFWERLQQPAEAETLKAAAIGGDLKVWTSKLTAMVAQTCHDLEWLAAAKGFPLNLLPQSGQEYLGIDVLAFSSSASTTIKKPVWQLPIAAFELENSRSDDRVAYSLWKVLCLRVRLGVIFAYRSDWEDARKLIGSLARNVISSLSTQERTALMGETIVVIGSKGEGSTFPWGYFKRWKLELNTGRFEKA
jgi:hypothetical protein